MVLKCKKGSKQGCPSDLGATGREVEQTGQLEGVEVREAEEGSLGAPTRKEQ